ncbi:MAG TPA: ABC transporter permease [Acidimicrobiales bacterium]|nr:ABC transporter permease [Acidimicrobiales bacterium]
MKRYVGRRILLLIPTLFGMSILTFGVSNLTPGDPAFTFASRLANRPATPDEVAQAREDLGLEGGLVTRYVRWAGNAVQGDLGISFSTRLPVRPELVQAAKFTLQLAIPAALLALLIAVPTGVVSAVRRNRPADQVLRVLSLAGASMPSFWLALLLVVLLAVNYSLLPAAGRAGTESYVLPIVTLALAPAAVLARFTRSAVLETLTTEYVVAARAKGAGEAVVVVRHALRNALVPLVTAVGNSLGHLVGGAAVVETVFVWPGIGRLMVEAILQRDYPVIAGIVLYSGAVFAVISLVVDLLYAVIDPRIRVGSDA